MSDSMYLTGNAVPSADPRDRWDNGITLDSFVSGNLEQVTTRTGKSIYTLAYLNRMLVQANSQISASVSGVNTAANNAKSQINQIVAGVSDDAEEALQQMTKIAEALGNDLNNKHYSTQALMLADPQNRNAVVAIVDNDPDPAKNGFYYFDLPSNTWIFFYDQPVMGTLFRSYVDEMSKLIQGSSSTEFPITFEDAGRFLLGWITRDRVLRMEGGIEMSGVRITQGKGALEVLDAANFRMACVEASEWFIGEFYCQSTNTPGVEITDENRFILQRWDASKASTSVVSSGRQPLALNAQQRTQIMLIIGYGQSLSRGINSIPAISTEQKYSNIMIASGTKIRNGDTGYNASSFVPMVATTEGTEGEDPVVGLCNGLSRRLVADGELHSEWQFLGTSPGRSARAVEQLGPSSDANAFFNKMVRYVRDAKNLSDSLNKSFSCWAYCWDQGESNYTGSYTRSPYLYAQLMLTLFDTLSQQIQDITGQSFRPYIFSYQAGGHRFYGVDNNTIAMSQWRISREREDFVLAVPVYAIPVVVNDVHLTNEGSWLLGEYRSRAMYQTMIRRSGKWRPLEPVQVDWQDGYIDVKFHVPSGKLVLDTALCAQTHNMGFDIREADAVVNVISSVEVVSIDTVRITLTRPASSGALLTYARGRPTDPQQSGPLVGARGNLRDTNGDFDSAVSPLGNTFKLHNPCVMFQYNRANGF